MGTDGVVKNPRDSAKGVSVLMTGMSSFYLDVLAGWLIGSPYRRRIGPTTAIPVLNRARILLAISSA